MKMFVRQVSHERIFHAAIFEKKNISRGDEKKEKILRIERSKILESPGGNPIDPSGM